MTEWKEYKLGDFIKVKHGFAFKGDYIVPDETDKILVTPGNFHIGGGFKSDKFNEGVKVCSEVAALPSPKYDAAIAQAKKTMAQYTNNKIATLQQANDFDGIIAMAESIADKALAQRVLVQAYFLKKDYAKVIEIGEAAAEAQTDDEGKSAVYFNLGSAYNAKENKAKALECLKKVTAEPYATPAKAAVAELSK